MATHDVGRLHERHEESACGLAGQDGGHRGGGGEHAPNNAVLAGLDERAAARHRIEEDEQEQLGGGAEVEAAEPGDLLGEPALTEFFEHDVHTREPVAQAAGDLGELTDGLGGHLASGLRGAGHRARSATTASMTERTDRALVSGRPT